nr:uncharacterized protein LOC129387969 [Dermacentor andersoni]
MPGCCCAPNCKSNYDGGQSVRVHKFPSDRATREAWTRAVPRKDFSPTKYTVLCEKHFLPSDYLKTTSYTDVKTGKVVEVAMKNMRLKKTAVPSLFPNCPAYLSRPQVCVREAPAAKRARLEATYLQKAIMLSQQTQAEEDAENLVNSFADLLKALPSFRCSDFWTVLNKGSKVFFFDLSLQSAPAVRTSVIVSTDLRVEVFFGETGVRKCGDVLVPEKLCDLRDLKSLLHMIDQTRKDISTERSEKARHLLTLVSTLLEEVSGKHFACELQEWHLEVLKFLKSQVDLVLNDAGRYPPDLLVFASLLFTISPQAYRFLRSSMKLKMPHPDTIKRLCSSYDVRPETEQQECSFLSYAKRIVSTYKEHEKSVTLMIDEIHLQSFFDYKAGLVTGAAVNSSTAAKTPHVFMIQSLLSSNKDVVHMLPVAQIDAKALHDFLRKIVLDLEASGFRIIAVISDNNSINRKAMSYFAKPASVSIVYQHPADPSRPLFFVVDPVHIIKCIRNNWLNQRNIDKCMYFPEPKSDEAEPKILTASFKVLCQLHEAEKHELLKLAPTLTLKPNIVAVENTQGYGRLKSTGYIAVRWDWFKRGTQGVIYIR